MELESVKVHRAAVAKHRHSLAALQQLGSKYNVQIGAVAVAQRQRTPRSSVS
jgi:hypothetical protein